MSLKTDLYLAYRKLKSYVYHENFSLPLRIQIAEFEDDGFQNKMNSLIKRTAEFIETGYGLEDYLKNINYFLVPKRFKNSTTNDFSDKKKAFYYSNLPSNKTHIVEKITVFIECPVELHILTVLWVMKIGHRLDAELLENCYGNRLIKNESGDYDLKSLKLFYPYYSRYNSWRDEAIKKAKDLHSQNLDVGVLNLDLQEYYHSVDFNFKSFEIPNQYLWLNKLLESIHKKYYLKLQKARIIKNKNALIPIGLVSSSILANYYLKDFDRRLVGKVRPEFYGRYVDDIIMVFSNPTNVDGSVEKFIKNNLCDKSFWDTDIQLTTEGKNEYLIYIYGNTLKFQIEKVKFYHFLSDAPINLLKEFEKEIQKNCSEFRLQPESENIFEEFETSSFKISYSDTINKLRSIEDFKSDKLGASKHLTKLIKTSLLLSSISKKEFEKIDAIIQSYFTGQRSLELYQLWEKAFTFYLINGASESLIKLAQRQIEIISEIEFKTADESIK